jgi:hypothetical protein
MTTVVGVMAENPAREKIEAVKGKTDMWVRA